MFYDAGCTSVSIKQSRLQQGRFIHSIGMCRMRQFLVVLRSFCHSSLLHTFPCHPSPPTILPSSLTSSCHLFLGLPLNFIVPEFISNTLLGILFSSILCTCPNQCNLYNLIVSITVSFLTLTDAIIKLTPFFLYFKPLNTKLNPICHLLALLEAHHILHVSRIRVKAQWLTVSHTAGKNSLAGVQTDGAYTGNIWGVSCQAVTAHLRQVLL